MRTFLTADFQAEKTIILPRAGAWARLTYSLSSHLLGKLDCQPVSRLTLPDTARHFLAISRQIEGINISGSPGPHFLTNYLQSERHTEHPPVMSSLVFRLVYVI